MKRLIFALTALALGLSSCAPPAEVAPQPSAPKAGSVRPNGRVSADPALWVVKDADTTVYLFGSIHVLRANVDWFDDEVKRAFDASRDVVLEAVAPDSASDAQKLFLAIAIDPDGPPLSRKLDPALRARYNAAMAANGLPVGSFETFEPWFVASQLGLVPLEKLGYSAESGVEIVLTRAAKAAGKPLSGLETFEEQLRLFDTLAEPLQIRFLASTIDELGDAEKTFRELSESWTTGDADRLGRLMTEGLRDTPEIARILLADRNARWSQWIDDRLDRPGTTFVAVGAGHLAGTDSVQAMLARRGIAATRVR